jgi:alcohol dehydrogenase
MKALIFQGPGKKALEERPKPTIAEPTDAIVKISRTTICGTDLHIIKGDVPTCQPGRVLGHEGVGFEAVAGAENAVDQALALKKLRNVPPRQPD